MLKRDSFTKETIARFKSKVIYLPDGCWGWAGSFTGGGYGKFTLSKNDMNGQKPISSHRFSYLLYKGDIVDGLQIDHLCRNRWCCNPDHLEAVTCQENLLRGETSAAANKAKTHCVRGHEFDSTQKGGKWRRCRECERLSRIERRDEINAHRRARYATGEDGRLVAERIRIARIRELKSKSGSDE